MRTLLFLGLFAVAPAHAGSTLAISSISADGQEIRDVTCDLASGGLFASLQVVGSIAGQKTAFDACKPTGAAFRATWTWAGGATTGVAIQASSAPEANTCVKKALEAVTSSLAGQCTAVVLVGEATAAQAAAASLAPAAAANPPTSP